MSQRAKREAEAERERVGVIELNNLGEIIIYQSSFLRIMRELPTVICLHPHLLFLVILSASVTHHLHNSQSWKSQSCLCVCVCVCVNIAFSCLFSHLVIYNF